MNKKNFVTLMAFITAVTCAFAFVGCSSKTEHEHTFANVWTNDETYHWHAATCEHKSEISAKAEHSFVNGKCSVCQYEKLAEHEHTYSEEWTNDETYHWHAATCEHLGEISGKAEHNFTDGKCSACGYQTAPPETKATCSFELNEGEDGYVVTGFEEEGTVLEIPATYAGLPITEIGEKALRLSSLVKVTIPDSVKKIDEQAFYACSSLTSVDLGKGVETIGKYAFRQTAVKEISIPESLTQICFGAFAYTDQLKAIEIPSNVAFVEDYAFWNGGIETIKIDANTAKWGTGQSIFSGCENMKQVIFGENASANAYLKFDTCYTVLSYTAEKNPHYKSINGMLCSMDLTKVLRGPLGATSAVIPEGVTEIGEYAFMDSKLETVAFPNTVKTIGKRAFENSKINSVSIPDSVAYIDDRAFASCKSLTELNIGEGLSFLYGNPFRGCSCLNYVTITQKNKNFYSENGAIIKITTALIYGGNVLVRANLAGEIPSGVVYLDGDAFYDCTEVEHITIPASVNRTSFNIFAKCKNLKSVTFEDAQGWAVVASGASYPKDAIPISVTNAEANAEAFQTTYANYWWTKS